LRAQGYVAPALLNFLALLGWSYDDRTTVMSGEELVERFTLERVSKSAAIFDYDKLTWMNGVYLRAFTPDEYADALLAWLRDEGSDWDAGRAREAAPLVQEKITRLAEFPEFAGFLFGPVEPDPQLLAGTSDVLAAAADLLATLEPYTADAIETALRALAEERGLKPREAFQPIRVAVTGSRISPGLFESIDVLGREESVARLRAGALVAV
jgi:glutamyl-tRNA synthetase